MPSKTAAPPEIPYSDKSDPINEPAVTKEMAERLHALLSLSGDATLDKTGKLTIANDAVTAAKIKALAVEEGKIKDGAVASRKLKPTVGQIQATGNVTLTNAYQDVTGAKLEITPDVASKLLCVPIFGFEIVEKTLLCQGLLNVDGSDESNAVAEFQAGQVSIGTVSTISVVSLPEPGHKYTIKMRAQKFPNEGVAKALSGATRMMYQLVAS